MASTLLAIFDPRFTQVARKSIREFIFLGSSQFGCTAQLVWVFIGRMHMDITRSQKGSPIGDRLSFCLFAADIVKTDGSVLTSFEKEMVKLVNKITTKPKA